MTLTYSKMIPLLVLGIVVGSIGFEVIFDTEIDLEAYLPLLIPLGLTGASKSVLEKAIAARNAVPKNIQDIIRVEFEKLKTQ